MAEDEGREKKSKKRGGRVAILTPSEKKRRKKEYNKKLAASRIYIGGAIERWKSLREQTEAQSDEEMAKILLERFENVGAFKEVQRAHTSIAMKNSTSVASSIKVRSKTKKRDSTPGISEISARSEQEPMSGVQEVQVSGPEDTGLSTDTSMQDSDGDTTENEEADNPRGFDAVAIQPNYVNSVAENVVYEEAEFGFELPDNDGQLEGPEIEMEVLPGIHRVSTEEECSELTTATKCIAFVSQIKELTKICVPQCKEHFCRKPTQIEESFFGSVLYLKWICEEGHVSRHWCSQPQLNPRLHSGDFLICGSILTSGNKYRKMALWAEMLKLKFPSADQFHRICRTYIIPTIDNFRSGHQKELLNNCKDRDVVVLGDGRNHSPVH
ncbi:uncharacterized protein LOC125658891 isoform X2 [Ostrea edulis]|uniref:uncharacterized protein LOC125658891 isoform X2 n=1 Tax=Ostrea edulis TaxID=37623 RepID=UPI0024AF8249|nr:uncharacterized protein LOC125658891 isoform X2 [Ostrea edulis]XP_056004857.1 uncharacterized protein LOC125658891 isoform X2 [Ostrea edulis]